MIDIYLLCYNEEKILQFVIDHHRRYLPSANIVIYDNFSTDNSVNIMKVNGCTIRQFNTENSFNDMIHKDIKNSCWKEQSKNDWVLVGDLDELPCVTEDQLLLEERLGSTVLSLEGFTLIGPRDGFDLVNLKTGIRDGGHDKKHIFNRKHITDINYSPGAHKASPTGNVVYSRNKYKTLHYKWISLEYVRNRHRMYANRLSQTNKQLGMGIQYKWTDQKLTEVYDSLQKHLKVVI